MYMYTLYVHDYKSCRCFIYFGKIYVGPAGNCALKLRIWDQSLPQAVEFLNLGRKFALGCKDLAINIIYVSDVKAKGTSEEALP